MTSASSYHVSPPPRSTAERVLLLYGGSAGPPHIQRHGCMVHVGTAACGRGRRGLEGGPLYRTTQALVGSVLHPRQAAAYTRVRSTMTAPDLGLVGLDLGS
jgi:hypothetical protein